MGYIVPAGDHPDRPGYPIPAVRKMERAVPVMWPYPTADEVETAMRDREVRDPMAHPNVRPWRLFRKKDVYVTGGSKAEVIKRLLERNIYPRGCSPEEIMEANAKVGKVVTPQGVRSPVKDEEPRVEFSPRIKVLGEDLDGLGDEEVD